MSEFPTDNRHVRCPLFRVADEKTPWSNRWRSRWRREVRRSGEHNGVYAWSCTRWPRSLMSPWWSVCQSAMCSTTLVMCTRTRRCAVRRLLATRRRRCRGIQPPNAVIHVVHSPASTLSQSTRRSRSTQAFHVRTRRRSPGAVPPARLHLTPAGVRSPAPNPRACWSQHGRKQA